MMVQENGIVMVSQSPMRVDASGLQIGVIWR
jgi:hypothetical protein